jgi:creatinine amidohydrolase
MMKYEMMFPDQLEKAIDENWPVVLPFGVLEYHSRHGCLGVDTLLVVKAVEELENEMNIVVLPPFYYGAGSYVVASPERKGTVHVDSEAILPFGRDLFRSLLRIGFKNIHIFIHHQSENFYAGMPNDLALRLAARQVTFEILGEKKGEGWWGDDSMKDYYSSHAEGDNPFNWIQVHPFMSKRVQEKFPIDHAGKQETSLMMAFCPEGIDMNRYSSESWYAQSAEEANIEYANKAKKAILNDMRTILKGQTK